MSEIEKCQYLHTPTAFDHLRDKVYEGPAWCTLSDNPCYDGEMGERCEEYQEFLGELEREELSQSGR